MKIESKKRALDKIYKRRDRYEIPDWQRQEVWPKGKKQELVDSILKGWKLPKFYFLRTSTDPEEFEVVDGQQRLTSIFEFFDNELGIPTRKSRSTRYQDLPSALSDAFDDFEIEYDEISEASDADIRLFFQRLQQGLPLTSSEKLNAVHSTLRNYCLELAKHNFFSKRVNFSNKRYAHFDVAAKVATIEVEGLETGLRFDDIKVVFNDQSSFSSRSVVAKRLKDALNYLERAFPEKTASLRNRTLVQSIASLAAVLVRTGQSSGTEPKFKKFVISFVDELSKQVEMGLDATDQDYITFQKSVNANVRGAAKTRHNILLRKLLQFDPSFLNVFGPAVVAESGLNQEIKRLAEQVATLIEKVNGHFSAKTGKDLIKPTTKVMASVRTLGKPIRNYSEYKDFISGLYFVFWEGPGERLKGQTPGSFAEINVLRTDLQHDLDHGKPSKVSAKRKTGSATFEKYSSFPNPQTAAPESFPLFQARILNEIESDLRKFLT